MPFKSRAQQKYLFSQHPEIAKEFAEHTANYSKLPEHVRSKKKNEGGRIARENNFK